MTYIRGFYFIKVIHQNLFVEITATSNTLLAKNRGTREEIKLNLR